MEYTPLGAFQVYSAIQLHYMSADFDVRKYGFHLKKHNYEAYAKSRARYHIAKLYPKFRNEDELITFLGTAFFEIKPKWPGDITEKESLIKDAVRRQKKVTSAPAYHVKRQLSDALELYSFGQLMQNPDIFYELICRQVVDPELLCVCNLAFGMIELMQWDDRNIIHRSLKADLLKYSAFHKISQDDLSAIKQVSKNLISATKR